jgi:hypothetical protein
VAPKQKRSTVDTVVVILAATVGMVLIISTLGVVIGRMLFPQADYRGGAEALGNITTTLVGALVGFIGGRAQGKFEEAKANGVTKT